WGSNISRNHNIVQLIVLSTFIPAYFKFLEFFVTDLEQLRSLESCSPNETIDLCDTDDEPDSKNDSTVFNDIETITLDDDNCSVISDQTGRLSLSENNNNSSRNKSKKKSPAKGSRKSLTPKKLFSQQENSDEVEVIAVQINAAKRKVPWFNSAPKFISLTPKKLLGTNIGNSKKRFGQLSPTTVYRGISSNTLVKKFPKKKGKKGKKAWLIKQKEKPEAPSPQSRSPGKSKKNAKKATQKSQQARLILQSQPVNQRGKFRHDPPIKIMRNRGVPIENGKPKFRLEPAFPVDQLLKEAAFMTESEEKKSSAQSKPESSPEVEPKRIVTTKGTGPDCDNLTITCSSSVIGEGEEKALDGQINPGSLEEKGPDLKDLEANVDKNNFSAFGSNCYKAGPVQARTKGSLRPVVIDGSNVAWGHGNNEKFSCRGIKVCSDYFLGRGHSVVAFVPRYRLKQSKAQDSHILEELSKCGIVKFTPSREVEGLTICSYDDRFVVQYAADTGGIIVSNDNFRDLYDEQPLWREAIRDRILQYTWVHENYIMFPPDPLGPTGPPLDQFLRF
ncbi:unnamed protein product, partial [Allacma fusca]